MVLPFHSNSRICSCPRQVWPWQKFAKLVRQSGRCFCYVSAVLESGSKTNKGEWEMGGDWLNGDYTSGGRQRVSFGQLVLETKWKIDACRSYKERDAAVVAISGLLQIGRLVAIKFSHSWEIFRRQNYSVSAWHMHPRRMPVLSNYEMLSQNILIVSSVTWNSNSKKSSIQQWQLQQRGF